MKKQTPLHLHLDGHTNNHITHQESNQTSEAIQEILKDGIKVNWTKDSLGFEYLACPIPAKLVTSYLKQLQDHLWEEKFARYKANKYQRDGDEYHVTVVVRTEVENLEQSIDISGMSISDFKLIGLGKAEDQGNTTYFVVVESKQLDKEREKLWLPKKDFHITLWFDQKDVFTKPKDRSSLIKPF